MKSERDEPAVTENDDLQESSSTGRHRTDRRKKKRFNCFGLCLMILTSTVTLSLCDTVFNYLSLTFYVAAFSLYRKMLRNILEMTAVVETYHWLIKREIIIKKKIHGN
jgi:hypothetical protein